LQKTISTNHGKCHIVLCDVQNESSVSKAAKQVLKTHGRIDILINNAGVTYFKNFIDTTTKEFDQIISTNLRGVFLLTKAALPDMLKSGQGLVMNVISYITKEVYKKSAAYTASKAGVEAMMNVLRAEVRRRGINIVNVYPGAVSTSMWKPEHREKYGHQMLTAAQIAEMLYQISIQSKSLMVEEIVLRPQGGDLQG
jgi:short-subunit dehydrogenase